MAPPNTPAAVQAKLEADIKRVAMQPEMKKRLADAGAEAFVLGSADMMKLIRADAEKYAKAAQQSNIKVE